MFGRIVLIGLLLFTCSAFAQVPPTGTYDTTQVRLTILENRMSRVESDLKDRADVPTQLARIDEKLAALAHDSDTLGGNLNAIVLTVIALVMGSVTGYAWQKGRNPSGK